MNILRGIQMLCNITFIICAILFSFVPPRTSSYINFMKSKPKVCLVETKEYENNHLRHAIQKAAELSGLPDTLIDAIISVESSGMVDAVSNHGAVGPMQVMKIAASMYPEYDRYDPYENVIIGSLYLAYLLDEFGNLKMALAAYNYGETDVRLNGFRAVSYVNKVKLKLKGDVEI